jgi:hypothetical protein
MKMTTKNRKYIQIQIQFELRLKKELFNRPFNSNI